MLRAIACSCFNIRGKHAIHGNRLNLLGNCSCVVLHMDVRMPRAQATAWMPEVEQRRSSCRMRLSGLYLLHPCSRPALQAYMPSMAISIATEIAPTYTRTSRPKSLHGSGIVAHTVTCQSGISAQTEANCRLQVTVG